MKAERTIERYAMLDCGSTVLAGVSGGADSMALLHLLCSLRGPKGITVYAAHVNHGLRGEEAQRDEDHVRRMCEAWGVRLFVLKADVAKEARAHESVEQAGRRIRYAFFEKKAGELGAKIATAHTLSDSIETLLLNLARGTGLAGLCGIPPVRGNIIRPLIETTRGEVEEYCRKNAILYMNDSTNFSRAYARNRLRLDAVPVLYAINPAFDRAACRAMRSLAQDEALLSKLAADALERARIDVRSYDLAQLNGQPAPIRARALALAARRALGVKPEALHIERLSAMLAEGRGLIELNGGGFARAQEGKLTFLQASELSGQNEAYRLPFEAGYFVNSRYGLRITVISNNEIKNLQNSNKPYFKNAIDCDKIIGKAVIRSRLPGDSYRPAGRGHLKTLKKLFNEAKIPVCDRPLVPVVCDEKGILWVCGFGADERCTVTDTTRQAFLLEEI